VIDESVKNAAGATATLRGHRWERAKTWALRLAEYGLVQVGVQALTALAGLMIVRSLSKPEYALFAIANSMQVAANSLADVGIGIGVRSIGGKVWNDPQRFGQLLNTTLNLRRKFAAASLAVTLPIAAWMLYHNGASLPVALALCVVIAVSVIPMLGITAWMTSAQLHGEYRRMQKLDFSNAFMRCALIGLLAVTWINAIVAALVGTIGYWVQMAFLKRWAREKVVPDATPVKEDEKELLRLSGKSLVNTIFFCVQGQVTLLILTLVGNTMGIAEITALGRIALLFSILSVTFTNVLVPRFARCQDPNRLPRLYLLLSGGAALLLALLTLMAWLFPSPFLWLLGAKYNGLKSECALVVAAGCVSQIGGIMWNLNSCKAWINLQVYGFIPSIITVQILSAITLNLHEFHNVLIFNLLSAIAPLPVFALDAIRGMRQCADVIIKKTGATP